MPVGKTRVTKNWRWRETGAPSSCAKNSFRTLKRDLTRSGKHQTLITVCCPKGKWQPGAERCAGGMKPIAVGRRKKGS